MLHRETSADPLQGWAARRVLLGFLSLACVVLVPSVSRAQTTNVIEEEPPGDGGGGSCTITGFPGINSPTDGAEVNSGSVAFDWDALSDPDADSYQVQVYEGTYVSGTPARTTITSNTSKSFTLDPETYYTWRVRGYGDTCEGAWSWEPTFQTRAVAPSPPTLQEPDNGAAGTSATPSLNWSNATYADEYRVQVAPSSSFSAPVLDLWRNYSSYSWTTSRLAYETTYYWRVKSRNEGGTSGWSATHSFTTGIEPPAMPQLLSPIDDAPDRPRSVTLAWQATDRTDDYRVVVEQGNSPVESTTTSATEWTVTGLSYNTTYDWQVYARNQDHETSSEEWSFTTRVSPAQLQAQRSVHAVKSTSLTVPVESENAIGGLSARQRRTSIAYVDALGRAFQSVAEAQSPNGHDVVTPVTRDALGRQTTTLLPYVATSGSGYRPGALQEQQAFYQNPPGGVVGADVPVTEYPYSRRVPERSPLERAAVQGAPGAYWQPADAGISGSGHTTRTRQGTNGSGEVRRFSVTGSGAAPDGRYPAGALYETTTTDPNGNVSVVYKDKAGREVMKKSRVSSGTWAKTYYLYDRRGNLRFVLPPEGTQALGGASLGDVLAKWGTEYRYDGYGREIAKIMPEEEPVTTVYDRLGRVVLRQDGLMRANEDWLFTKYDRYGRTIMTGIYHHGQGWTRQEMQDHIDALADASPYETRTSGGVHGYTNGGAFPQLDVQAGSDDVIWTVRYYDDYDFDRTGGTRDAQFDPVSDFSASGYMDGETYVEGHRPFWRLRGRATRTRTRVLEGGAAGSAIAGKWITETTFYDRKGRAIQTQTRSPLLGGETTTTSTQYDFSGKTLRTVQAHATQAGAVTTRTRYEFDDAGRRVRTYRQTGQSAWVLLAESVYNALGARIEKRLHAPGGGQGAFAQHVDYRRNVRGWLTSVNDAGAGDDPAADLFSMELTYASHYGYLGGERRYDGSVSQMRWSTAGDLAAHGYGYTYDGLGRLREAHYAGWQGGAETATNRYNMQSTYDLNGNLSSLQRRGQEGLIDDLSYAYRGNRLAGVAERAPATAGHDFTEAAEPEVEVTPGGAQRQLALTEVHYDSEHDTYWGEAEYVEVTNVSSTPVDLEGWEVRDLTETRAQYYRVERSFVLQPGERALFANGYGGQFAARYGAIPDFDLYEQDDHVLRLANSGGADGDVVGLVNPAGDVADFVAWDGTAYGGRTWYAEQDGDREALVRQQVTQASQPSDWAAAARGRFTEYGYDGNGSLIVDKNKGIRIENNYVNLPKEIAFAGGGRIAYAWAADGRKLRTYVYDTDGSLSENTHYAAGGSFVYEAGRTIQPELAYFSTSEGRAVNDGGWAYEYHLTDHLGNTRVAFVPDGQGAQVVQEQAYYPYGLRMAGLGSSESGNDYLYNGKELEDAHGLRWYHYGARFYDPAIAKWASMDPADEFHSPYSYVGGDPVNLVDPDGRQSANADDGGWASRFVSGVKSYLKETLTFDMSENNRKWETAQRAAAGNEEAMEQVQANLNGRATPFTGTVALEGKVRVNTFPVLNASLSLGGGVAWNIDQQQAGLYYTYGYGAGLGTGGFVVDPGLDYYPNVSSLSQFEGPGLALGGYATAGSGKNFEANFSGSASRFGFPLDEFIPLPYTAFGAGVNVYGERTNTNVFLSTPPMENP